MDRERSRRLVQKKVFDAQVRIASEPLPRSESTCSLRTLRSCCSLSPNRRRHLAASPRTACRPSNLCPLSPIVHPPALAIVDNRDNRLSPLLICPKLAISLPPQPSSASSAATFCNSRISMPAIATTIFVVGDLRSDQLNRHHPSRRILLPSSPPTPNLP
jgi:hypothetical protein